MKTPKQKSKNLLGINLESSSKQEYSMPIKEVIRKIVARRPREKFLQFMYLASFS